MKRTNNGIFESMLNIIVYKTAQYKIYSIACLNIGLFGEQHFLFCLRLAFSLIFRFEA